MRQHTLDEVAICSQFKAGSTILGLADTLGVGRSTIRLILKRHNVYEVRRGRRKPPPPATKTWIALWRQGVSYREIARRYYGDVARHRTIGRWIQRVIREVA